MFKPSSEVPDVGDPGNASRTHRCTGSLVASVEGASASERNLVIAHDISNDEENEKMSPISVHNSFFSSDKFWLYDDISEFYK